MFLLEILRKEFIKEIYEYPFYRYQGVYKTTKRIQRIYDFPKLTKLVKEVIGEYNTYYKVKASKH